MIASTANDVGELLTAAWVLLAFGLLAVFLWPKLNRRAQHKPLWKFVKWYAVLAAWGLTAGIVAGLLEAVGLPAKSRLNLGVALTLTMAIWIGGWLVLRQRDTLRQEAEMVQRTTTKAREQAKQQRQNDASERERDRRHAVNAQCLSMYLAHAPELATRFPRSAFDEYVRQYLGTEHRLGLVELRGQELIALMQSHLDQGRPRKQSLSLEEILANFESARQRIESAGLEPEQVDELLVTLEASRDDAIKKAVHHGTL